MTVLVEVLGLMALVGVVIPLVGGFIVRVTIVNLVNPLLGYRGPRFTARRRP